MSDHNMKRNTERNGRPVSAKNASNGSSRMERTEKSPHSSKPPSKRTNPSGRPAPAPGRKGEPAAKGTRPARQGQERPSKRTSPPGKTASAPGRRPEPATRSTHPVQPGQGSAKRRSPATPGTRRAVSRAHSGRRSKRRRRLNAVFYSILVVLFVLSVGITLSLTVFFHIETIEVQGQSPYSDEQIIEMSGIKTGKNLLLLDTRSGVQEIQSKLPYIEQAEIQRRIPTGVVIKVKEAVPVLTVEVLGRYALISEAGKVLELAETPPVNVFQLLGAAIKTADPGEMLVFQSKTDENIFSDITGALKTTDLLVKTTSVNFSDSTDITVFYGGQFTLHLGAGTDLRKKLELARGVIEQKIADGEVRPVTILLTADRATVRMEEIPNPPGGENIPAG